MSANVIAINERSGLLKVHGTITEELAIEFTEAVSLLVGYYQHRHIRLHINSDGGEVLALRYILDGMRARRDAGITFASETPFRACSAAAILLASGEWGMRSVSRQSFLLFHHARKHFPVSHVLTADDALRLAGMLSHVDSAFEDTILNHLIDSCGSLESLIDEGVARCVLLKTHVDSLMLQRATDSSSQLLKIAETVMALWVACRQNRSTAPYVKFMHDRFCRDDRMDLLEAYALVLIDCVDQVPTLLPHAASYESPMNSPSHCKFSPV